MVATNLLQPCNDGKLLKPCADPKYLQPCYGPTCWTVCTVTFAKDPGSISSGCIGCAGPGVAFSHFFTSAADGSDLDVMVTCLDMPYTICSGVFVTPLHLSTMAWNTILDDPAHLVYCYVRKSQNAAYKQGGCPQIVSCPGADPTMDPTSGPCVQGDKLPEMGLPHTFADPGGPSRITTCNGTVPVRGCGGTSWCVTTNSGVQSSCSQPLGSGPGEGPPGCPALGSGPS